MAKKIDLNTLLTKLSNVFKKDMIVYKYMYCIGGKNSEEENEGIILCTLNEECIETIKEAFEGKEYINFLDIKKAKKEPDTFIKTFDDEFTRHVIDNKFKNIRSKIDSKGKWDELVLTEEDVIDIFFDRNLHRFFEDDENITTLDLAKSAFPLLSEKNISDTTIMYKPIEKEVKDFDQNDELAEIVISYSTEWFQLDEYIMYIKMDD